MQAIVSAPTAIKVFVTLRMTKLRSALCVLPHSESEVYYGNVSPIRLTPVFQLPSR